MALERRHDPHVQWLRFFRPAGANEFGTMLGLRKLKKDRVEERSTVGHCLIEGHFVVGTTWRDAHEGNKTP